MARLPSFFSSKDREFFDLFEAAGANAAKASRLLEEMLRDYPERADLREQIVACEDEGDRLTHTIIRRLNETYVTPIEREDIYELASALDDVADLVDEVADYLGLYRIEAPMVQSQRLAEILRDACAQVAEALGNLRTLKDVGRFTVEINRLENEGDRVVREAIASLFDGGIDPMVVIRWKDLFERLEEAIDATEKVANIIEGIAISNA